jgi:DUF4097 and DUF4098 domain-containing protein YvlB
VTNGRHRRSSIFAGLLLILLGFIFLAEHLDPTLGIGRLIRVYWPVLLILWGVAKLIDHLAARKSGQARAPMLSGGEAVLLVVLALILSGFVFRDWIRDHYPDFGIRVPPFHQPYSQSRQLAPKAIPVGAHVVIETDRGDITVHEGEGNELAVSVNQSAWAPSESRALERMKQAEVAIEQAGNDYVVRPVRRGDFQRQVDVNLDVEVPKTSSVTAHTAHGDIDASGVTKSIEARTESGDIEIVDAGSDVTATLKKGDVRINRAGGNVRVLGRGDDVEVTNVSGDATVEGIFLGSGLVRNVKGTTRCTSPWLDLTVAQLSGKLEIDARQITLSDAAGPAKIATHNKDIQVQNVTGRLNITDAHSDIKVGYSSAPENDVNIANDAGDVELTLPASSSFIVSAVSQSGQVESDFKEPSQRRASDEDTERLSGQFGGKPGVLGPRITIATSYGTIRLRKSD